MIYVEDAMLVCVCVHVYMKFMFLVNAKQSKRGPTPLLTLACSPLTLPCSPPLLPLAHPLTDALQTPYGLRGIFAHAVVLEHPGILSQILTLNLEAGLRGDGVEDKVVVAVGAVLVAVVKLLDVLAEALFALFAGKHHFQRRLQVVRFRLGVAFGAIEPFLACYFFLWLVSF